MERLVLWVLDLQGVKLLSFMLGQEPRSPYLSWYFNHFLHNFLHTSMCCCCHSMPHHAHSLDHHIALTGPSCSTTGHCPCLVNLTYLGPGLHSIGQRIVDVLQTGIQAQCCA